MTAHWTLNGSLTIGAMQSETLSCMCKEAASPLSLMDMAWDFSSEDCGLESHRGCHISLAMALVSWQHG